MILESINIGREQTIDHGRQSITTGICKYPAATPVTVGELGVQNDVIVDQEHHGGADQAIYAYSSDDYDWWSDFRPGNYGPGVFGENLTIRGLPSNMNVGDRLLIGEVVLEATAPRIPCGKLSARMQDVGIGIAFRQAERPGIYFRVLNGGDIRTGDAVTFVEGDATDVTIIDLFHFYYALRHDAANLQQLLEAPLAERFRAKVEMELAKLESSG